jgi:hypothetical protein
MYFLLDNKVFEFEFKFDLPYEKVWSHNSTFSMDCCRSLFSQDGIHLSKKGLYHL